MESVKKKSVQQIVKDPNQQSSIVNDKTMIVNNEDCWYFGAINRAQAEDILIKNGSSEGLFLVRESIDVHAGDYVLSTVQNGTIVHYQICKRGDDAFFSIDDGPVFHGLDTLIKYYHQLNRENYITLTTYCMGKNAPPETRLNGRSNLLHRASAQGNENVVAELLKAKYRHNLDAKNEEGQNAIHLSVEISEVNCLGVLYQLINAGAHVNARDSKGLTPLHYAALHNNPSAVKLLMVEGQANAQCKKTDNGWVPMHIAAQLGHKQVIKTLLECGAPSHPRSIDNETPYDIAKRLNNKKCVQLLDSYMYHKCNNCPPLDQCLHDQLTTREEANRILEPFMTTDGTFLVRKSQTKSDSYILVMVYESRIFNFQIQYHNNFYFIDDGPYWTSLETLICYYIRNSHGLPTILTKPVPPKKPVPLKKPVPPKNSVIKKKDNLKHSIIKPKFIYIQNKNLQLSHLIGEGEFGRVYHGIWQRENNTLRVAVKVLEYENEKNTENILREVKVMTNLEHPFIIKLLGMCRESPMMMVQELAPMGSVLDFLTDQCNRSREIDATHDIKLWSAQIAFGMRYLESRHFVHRDLAARNILLASLNHIKISDFGLSRYLQSSDNYYKATSFGKWPIKWYAPESVNFSQFTHASDVWSYGVVLWELYSFGKQPYHDIANGADVVKFLEEGKRLSQPLECPNEIYTIIKCCWAYDSKIRPTFTELCQFFTNDPTNECIKDELTLKCCLESAI